MSTQQRETSIARCAQCLNFPHDARQTSGGRLRKPNSLRMMLSEKEPRCAKCNRVESDVIEAVIWDVGGVFTTSPFEAFARYEREKGLPKDLIRTINSTNHENNAWARFERAELDIAGFDKAFAEEAAARGHKVPGGEIL